MSLSYHEAADLFPLLEGKDFQELREDIAGNGLLEPIWLHADGRILDGRNRYRACLELGIEPKFRQWDGHGSALQFVVSLNLTRRHLTSGQRACLAIDVLPMLEAEARERMTAGTNQYSPVELIPQGEGGKSRDHAADMFKTNPRYVSDAKKLKNEAPEVFNDVKSGKTSLNYAMRKAGASKAARRREARNVPTTESPAVPRLILGDALCIDLPDESVDVIVTSPPYNLGDESWPMGGHGREERAGIGYDDALQEERYQEWQLAVLDELFRLAKPGGSLFYNHKTRTQNGRLNHPMLWLQHVRGWTLRQEIIWDRETTHNHSATLFWPIDERIYWFTKGQPVLGNEPVGMATVWRFHGPEPYTWHPAPFPEELPRRCLQAVGRPGMTVLDPFAGSCTTLRVALAMGYEAVGVELKKEFIEEARRSYGW